MAGPRTASSAAGVLPATAQRRATAASSTPAAAPRQPACTAAAARAPRAIRSTGTQSAVTTPSSRPAVVVTSASASPGGASARVTTAAHVPCTWRAVTTGSATPAAATTGSHRVAPAHARRSRNPCRSPGAAPHGAYVSTRSDDHPLEAHVAPPQQLAQRVELVLALVEDAADAGVDEHLEAVNAGGVGDVDVRAADADAVLCRLRDRVDLGVDGAEAVLLDLAGGRLRGVDQAAHVGAVREPSRGAVVAGGEDVAIADDDRAHLGAQARRALGHLAGDGEEVLIPGRAVAAHGRILNGSATNVSAKRTRLKRAAPPRQAPSGRPSSRVGGWPSPAMKRVIAPQTSQPGQPRSPSHTRQAISSAGSARVRCPTAAKSTWPPSSWPTGRRLTEVTNSPNQPANATGWSTTLAGSAWSTRRARKAVSSESPSSRTAPWGAVGRTVEWRSPTTVAASATKKPAHGPAAPMSKSARRSGNRERMRMKAPKVPRGKR